MLCCQLAARIEEERRLAEEMEEVRQELYLEEEAEREHQRQLAELEKRQRQRDELIREQQEMKIQRQMRLQAERDQEEVYKQQVGSYRVVLVNLGRNLQVMLINNR